MRLFVIPLIISVIVSMALLLAFAGFTFKTALVFIYNLLPLWVWVLIGLWLYFNIGWRFAEYKLRVAENWKKHHPVKLLLLWPFSTKTNSPFSISTNWDFWDLKEDTYKTFTMILWFFSLFLNTLWILFLFDLWILTWGRSKPIHPEIWKTYKKNLGRPPMPIPPPSPWPSPEESHQR